MSEIIPATTSRSTAAHTSQASTTIPTNMTSSSIPTNMTSSSLKSAPAPCPSTTFTETELIILCGKRKWKEASERAKYVPSEAYISCQPYGSALALCCRYGAPQETIQDVLHACPEQIRYSAGSYGTPLHEAIANESIKAPVLHMLIQADVELYSEDQITTTTSNLSSKISQKQQRCQRAARSQDIDGQVPLHLLVRRIFLEACSGMTRLEHLSDADDSGHDFLDSQTEGDRNDCCSYNNDESSGSSDSGDGVMTRRSTHDRNEDDDEYDPLLGVARELVHSCPESCAIPDHREYEETPLVMALKASVYAAGPSNNRPLTSDIISEDGDIVQQIDGRLLLEERIYRLVRLILQAYPAAALYVASTGYTILHSTLFHGRCAKTVELISKAIRFACSKNAAYCHRREQRAFPLPAGATERCPHMQRAQERDQQGDHQLPKPELNAQVLCCHPNSPQLEVPLHFACMRNDNVRVLRSLCRLCPGAVHARDRTGLTPLQWLWIRFISNSSDPPNADDALEQNIGTTGTSKTFSLTEVDTPVDFLRMRYVPHEYKKFDAIQCTHVANTLLRLHHGGLSVGGGGISKNDNSNDEVQQCFNSREDARVVAFWNKALVLLSAAAKTEDFELLNSHGASVAISYQNYLRPKIEEVLISQANDNNSKTTILHTAAGCSCCPPSIVKTLLHLYPGHLYVRDSLDGALPLHRAACRNINRWNIEDITYMGEFHGSVTDDDIILPSLSSVSENNGGILANGDNKYVVVEPVLYAILSAKPNAARVCDFRNRLPLHYVIDTFQRNLANLAAETNCSEKAQRLESSHEIMEESTLVQNTTQHSIDTMNFVPDPVNYLRALITHYPESLERRDGVTKLYPFMQAAASVTNSSIKNSLEVVNTDVPSREKNYHFDDHLGVLQLTIVYCLLRECPSLVRSSTGDDIKQQKGKPNQVCRFSLDKIRKHECVMDGITEKRARLDQHL